MGFSIVYYKQAEEFLKKSDKHIAKRIIDKIDEVLISNPIPHNSKAIVGEHGVFRLRIGNYRALYRIKYKEDKIIIIKLDKRSRVYE